MKIKVFNLIALFLNFVMAFLCIFSVICLNVKIIPSWYRGTYGTLLYFTVLSNILLALVSLFVLPFNISSVLKGKQLPEFVKALKMVAVTSTTVTMLTAIIYLMPIYGFDEILGNVNLFLHLINPVIGLVSFIIFESKGSLKFRDVFLCIVPVFVYTIFYFVAIFFVEIRIKGVFYRDWYQFAYDYHHNIRGDLNVLKAIVSTLVMNVLPIVLGAGIWLFNKVTGRLVFGKNN